MIGLIGSMTKKLVEFGIKNSPTILTICAAGGTIGTAAATGKAVMESSNIIKAHEMDEELKCERIEQVDGVVSNHLVYYRERTAVEKVRLVWKVWVPPVFLGTTTLACIFGSNSINTKRNLALAAAYSMSEETAREFRSKVAETIGEKKLNKIDDEIVRDHIEKTEANEIYDVTHTPYGEQLMYDVWSDRYFRSGQNEVEKRVNMLCKRMIYRRCDITLNDYYELLGLNFIGDGDYWGWKIKPDEEEQDIKVTFHPAISPHGEACIGVRIEPELLGKRLGV